MFPKTASTQRAAVKTPSVKISAPAVGVAARKSAAKSLMVKSISCPTAETTGTADWTMARERLLVEGPQILQAASTACQ